MSNSNTYIPIHAIQYQYMQFNTYIIQAIYMQIHANTRPSPTTVFSPVVSVLGLYWLVFACILLVLAKRIHANTINTS
jgi:hypothetical protein